MVLSPQGLLNDSSAESPLSAYTFCVFQVPPQDKNVSEEDGVGEESLIGMVS